VLHPLEAVFLAGFWATQPRSQVADPVSKTESFESNYLSCPAV